MAKLKKQIRRTTQRLENMAADDPRRQRAETRLDYLQDKQERRQTRRQENRALNRGSTTAQQWRGDKYSENQEAVANIGFQNPNISGPLGGQTTTYNPETGEVDVNQTLSDPQQNILNQGQDLTNAGLQAALQQLMGGQFGQSFNPQMDPRSVGSNFEADRARIEEAAYGRLIGDTEDRYGREREELKQQLYNRGVSLDQIANNPEMQAFENRYQTVRDNARRDATMMGGDEYSRNFGIQEQLRSNQFAEQAGARNQQFGEMNFLQNMGTGLMLPSFQPYQGAQVNYASPNDLRLGYGALDVQRGQLGLQGQQLDLQRAQVEAAINRMNQPAAPPPSPFIPG